MNARTHINIGFLNAVISNDMLNGILISIVSSHLFFCYFIFFEFLFIIHVFQNLNFVKGIIQINQNLLWLLYMFKSFSHNVTLL